MYSETKVVIAVVLIVLMLVGGILLFVKPSEPVGREYAQTTVVVETDKESDIVTCKDFNGVLWQFYGVEDWNVGDIATMIMNDNNTPIIYDDTIVHINYDGWLDGWK